MLKPHAAAFYYPPTPVWKQVAPNQLITKQKERNTLGNCSQVTSRNDAASIDHQRLSITRHEEVFDVDPHHPVIRIKPLSLKLKR
jgi:hypothetical protein